MHALVHLAIIWAGVFVAVVATSSRPLACAFDRLAGLTAQSRAAAAVMAGVGIVD